ncbi:hypothetical protein RIF29_07148 [Crotalaria pallida]|uniref:Diacylglycerol O-acyltransferase 3, cytosolic n=1 Tax=Crotalaria pallida TaxID=3830 RepID=A0AAN9J436_CROPI
MELSGTVLRQVPFHGVRVSVGPRRSAMMRSSFSAGFCDQGHLQYYAPPRCGGKEKDPSTVLTVKKKLKLLKGLSKDLSMFSQLGFDLDPQKRPLFDHLQRNLNSDAAELLMKQLEQARAEEKEMKKKMKQEKKEKKAKLKAAKMKTAPDCESSSSSSESSDSECDDKVVDMNTLRAHVAVAPVEQLQPTMLSQSLLLPHTTVVENPQVDATSNNHQAMELCSRNDTCVSSTSASFKNESVAVFTTAPQKRIEVCMGNKCKKSGAAALLQQFETVVGAEGGAVVGCKCMGKCKTAPNVRVQNAVDDSLAKGLNDSVQIPANPLCIGVGLEDVDAIVARFFGGNQEDMGMAAAAT